MQNLKIPISEIPLALRIDYFICDANIKSIEGYARRDLKNDPEKEQGYLEFLECVKNMNSIQGEYMKEMFQKPDKTIPFTGFSKYNSYIKYSILKSEIILTRASIEYGRQFRFKYCGAAMETTSENMVALTNFNDLSYLKFIRLVRMTLLLDFIHFINQEDGFGDPLRTLIVERIVQILENRTVYGDVKMNISKKEIKLSEIIVDLNSEIEVDHSVRYIINHFTGYIDPNAKTKLLAKIETLCLQLKDKFDQIVRPSEEVSLEEKHDVAIIKEQPVIDDDTYRRYKEYKTKASAHVQRLYEKLSQEKKPGMRHSLFLQIKTNNELLGYYKNQMAVREKQIEAGKGWSRFVESGTVEAFEKIQGEGLNNLLAYLGYNLGQLFNGRPTQWIPDAKSAIESIFGYMIPLISTMPGGSFLTPFLSALSSTFFASSKPSLEKFISENFSKIDKKLANIVDSINISFEVISDTILSKITKKDITDQIGELSLRTSIQFKKLAIKIEDELATKGVLDEAEEAVSAFEKDTTIVFQQLLGSSFILKWNEQKIVDTNQLPSDNSLLGGFTNMYEKYKGHYDILTYFNELQNTIDLISNFIQNQFAGLGYISQSHAILFMKKDKYEGQSESKNIWNTIHTCFKLSDYREIKKGEKYRFVNAESQIKDFLHTLPQNMLGKEDYDFLRQIHDKAGFGCYFTLLPTHKFNNLKVPDYCLSNHYLSGNLNQDFIRKEINYGFNAQTFKIHWNKGGSYIVNGADLGRSKIFGKSHTAGTNLEFSKDYGTAFNMIKVYKTENVMWQIPSLAKKNIMPFLGIEASNLFDDKGKVELNEQKIKDKKPVNCVSYELSPVDIRNLNLIAPADTNNEKIPEIIASNAYFMPSSIIEQDKRYYSQNRSYFFVFNSINSTLEIYKHLPEKSPILIWPMHSQDRIQGDSLFFNAVGNLVMSKFVSDPDDPFSEPIAEIVYQSDKIGSQYSELLLDGNGTLMIRDENGFAVWYKNNPAFSNENKSSFLSIEHKGFQYFFDPNKNVSQINRAYGKFYEIYHFSFKLNEDRETYTISGQNFNGKQGYLAYDEQKKTIKLQNNAPEQGFFIPYHPDTNQYLFQPVQISRFPANGFLFLDEKTENKELIKVNFVPAGVPRGLLSFKASIQNSITAEEFYTLHPLREPNKVAYIQWLGFVKKEKQLQLFNAVAIETQDKYRYQYQLKKDPKSNAYLFLDVRYRSGSSPGNAIDAYAGGDHLILHPFTGNDHQYWGLTPSTTMPGFFRIDSTIPNKNKSFDLYGGNTKDHAEVVLYPTQDSSTTGDYKNQLWWLKRYSFDTINTEKIYCIRPSHSFANNRAATVETSPSDPTRPTYKLRLDDHGNNKPNTRAGFQFTRMKNHGDNVYRIDAKANFRNRDGKIIQLSLQHSKYDNSVDLDDTLESPEPDSGQLWKIEFSYVSNFFYIISMKDQDKRLRFETGQERKLYCEKYDSKIKAYYFNWCLNKV